MKRKLIYLIVPVALMVVGLVLLTAFDWGIGGWMALIGMFAFAAVAWWANIIAEYFGDV